MIRDFLVFWHLAKPAQPTIAETLEADCLTAQRNYLIEQAKAEQHAAMAAMWLAQAARLHAHRDTLVVVS